ncbi:S66 family peptidase [Brachybacterium alimentarium]|uniref:S66 family peptidase n=1 Tax=Brachybacterium alimentarium TaxID=47845 RepID=UPI003FD0F5F1
MPTFPPLLQPGDLVRVIAPSLSRSWVTEHDHTSIIEKRFASMDLRLSYGRHVDERDAFGSSSIASRVADLHEAVADPEVRALLTVIGGTNSNELLPHLDFDLFAANPKILCGYSDITALQCAVLERAGLVTYSGPHWSSFGMREHFSPTHTGFHRALFDGAPFEVESSKEWTDDLWFLDQEDRHLESDGGWWTLQAGSAEGRVVGTNLCTLNLLQGTPYMPSLEGALLVLEDDSASDAAEFARNLTSLLQLPDADGVRGLVVGRFQRRSGVTRDLLAEIIARQPALAGKPVLAGADVGHTMPLATLPIGGRAELVVGSEARFRIVEG